MQTKMNHTSKWSLVWPLLILAAVFIMSLWFRTALPGIIPGQAMSNLWTAFRLFLADLLNQPLANDRYEIIENQPYYYETIIRLKNSIITLVAGMAVCAGGALFQTMFRNPLASPNIIGISTGVNLGTMIFILTYTTSALAMLHRRFIFCYLCAAVIVAITMLGGKLAGRRVGRFSVQDMLVVGALISQFGNILVTYLQYKIEEIDTELLTAYQELSMGLYVLTDLPNLLAFFLCIAAGLIPVLLLRFRMNATVFDDSDARSMGVNASRLRGIGMLCGAVLAIAALVECGNLGIVSMAIPPICRTLFRGADFRRVLYYSMCLGGIFLLVARSLCSLVYIGGMALPINFLLSLIILPLFVAALSKQRSVFE